MLFPDISPSRDQCLESVATALRSDGGRIYLDASLLIHCYEMGVAARDELFDALESFQTRVHVPLWSAKETWEFTSGRVKKRPLEAPAAKVRDHLNSFRSEARRYVDDDTVPDYDKDTYAAKLEEATSALLKLTNLVAKHEPKVDLTTARLMPFIEERRLKPDLTKILREVSETAENRYAHEVPPGFGDGGKQSEQSPTLNDGEAEKLKGKKKNRYGDLIVWLEILDDCAANKTEHLVVVTRDTSKGDWVYKPQKVLDDQGRPQNNTGAVTLPHPLLVHEATKRCPTLQSVHVVSVEMLAHVLRSSLKLQIPSLIAALQADGGARKTARKGDSAGGPEPENEGNSDDQARTIETVRFNSEDMDYHFTPDDKIDDALQSLGVDDWSVQNDAVQTLEPLLISASRDQLIQIGRGVVEASIGGAVGSVDFLQRVFANTELPDELKSHLLVGVLAEIYIAIDGEPKKPIAPPDLTELIYEQFAVAGLRPAYDAVIGRLESQRRAYLALPIDAREAIPIELALEKTVLRGAQTRGNPLLEEQAPETRLMNRLGRDLSMPVDELLNKLGREFVVPKRLLAADQAPSFQVVVPEYVGYVPWGPNTGTMLR